MLGIHYSHSCLMAFGEYIHTSVGQHGVQCKYFYVVFWLHLQLF